MKQLFILIACCLICGISFGQVTSFSGKVVDANNEPVPGARIKIYGHGRTQDVMADASGIFRIAQIPAGEYFADINANGQFIRAKHLLVEPDPRGRLLYNFKLFAKGVVITVMAHSRPIAAR